MIHGLHPLDVPTRVRDALVEVQGAVNADGTQIELLGIDGGTARLRFLANGHAPAPALRDLVEQAVLRAAPELEAVDVEPPAGAGGRNGAPALVQLGPSPRRLGDER